MTTAHPISPITAAPRHRWRASSLALIVSAWAILQLGGLFTPGLLDDVDSVYIQIAREMLQRHDFVTPTIDGIRFFDKPPLMYWMAAGSMHLFGIHDWAARLPLALGVLALLLAVYALGIRFYPASSPASPPSLGAPSIRGSIADGWNARLSPSHIPEDRGGLYAALVLATSLGPYLYTRFYIPDILIALWMTLAVHLFLIALNRVQDRIPDSTQHRTTTTQPSPSAQDVILSEGTRSFMRVPQPKHPEALRPATNPQTFSTTKSPLWPCLGFAAVLALSVLTKGLIGIVFPILFVLLYLALTHNLKALKHLHLLASSFVFALIAAPWHILAALRNPPIAMPPGLGLPARAGWAWFYLYNEHIARFLGRRIPQDYGQTPIWLFWLYAVLWVMPWAAFLPAAIASITRTLRRKPVSNTEHSEETPASLTPRPNPVILSEAHTGVPGKHSLLAGVESAQPKDPEKPIPATIPQPFLAKISPGAPFTGGFFTHGWGPHSSDRRREPALALILWALLVLVFFTLSSRQEYYSLPAIPALGLMVAGLLAAADTPNSPANRAATACHRWLLLPFASLIAIVCAYLALTAPSPHPDVTLNDVLSSNPALYNVSLGHVFDLTSQAMGFFRGPLIAVALGMLTLGPLAYLIRRTHTFAANLTIAAGMIVVLLAAHTGLVRFYPILGSKDLALAIDTQLHPGDLILIDGELTSGSTLLFYTPKSAAPILLVNGRVNGPWFGSFWPDAPKIFPTDADLHHLWSSPHRLFLLTYNPTARTTDLTPYGPVHTFATSGGKTILTNR